MKAYLAQFDVGSLKVTYDPANFLLHGHDPLANLTPLPSLPSTHALPVEPANRFCAP